MNAAVVIILAYVIGNINPLKMVQNVVGPDYNIKEHKKELRTLFILNGVTFVVKVGVAVFCGYKQSLPIGAACLAAVLLGHFCPVYYGTMLPVIKNFLARKKDETK